MPNDSPSSPSPSKLSETKNTLEIPIHQHRWKKLASWPVMISAILVLLVLGIGIISTYLMNYPITIGRNFKGNQTPSVSSTEENLKGLPTEVILEPESTLTPRSSQAFPSPTATKAVDISDLLTQAQTAFEQAIKQHNRQQAQAVLDLLTETETLDLNSSAQVAQLRSKMLFTLDTLDGTVYLSTENTTRWSLEASNGRPLLYPIDMTISDEGIYMIDSGTLYRGDWPISTTSDELVLAPILKPDAQINGYPVKEIVAVEAINTDGDVFVLDKANDIYRYEPAAETWYLETLVASELNSPDPLFLNLSSYANRLYILDPARNQVWRHPPNQAGPGFLPGTLPWLVKLGDPYINAGIDLAIDGNIYILQRDGVIVTYNPTETLRFSLAAADTLSRVPGWADLPIQPVAIFATVEGTTLHVADSGRRRVVTFDRTNGRIIRQLVAPDNLDFAAIHSITEKDGYLYILAHAYLYHYNLNERLTYPLSLSRQLPSLMSMASPDLSPDELQPNDLRLPNVLATYNFKMPLEDALLPDRGAVYPGSRRAYRYGVHQGLDLYGKDIGIEMEVGTPVYAVGNGIVIRTDTNYQEMTLDEVSRLLDNANIGHVTTPETLEKLNGRQIWIDHGKGVVTRYSHLSDIAENLAVGKQVAPGQLIGYIGLSGTPDGITGNTQFPHLHFEIRLGPGYEYYLGQWLTIEETRRAFERIFNVPVQPAYLEFRTNR